MASPVGWLAQRDRSFRSFQKSLERIWVGNFFTAALRIERGLKVYYFSSFSDMGNRYSEGIEERSQIQHLQSP